MLGKLLLCVIIMLEMGRTCVFQSSWLNKEDEDGIRVGDWCVADPSDKIKAKCLVMSSRAATIWKDL